jgi:cellulose synthase/poly-beta-1,6-N-acetylglucosamine synthase-like glycosyltransferase
MTFSYCACSVFFYIVVPPGLHAGLWYMFIVLQTFVTLTVLTEGISSLAPAIKSRKAVRKAHLEGFKLGDKAPKIDLIYPCYLPNEQDIIMRQMRYSLREINYPRNRLTIYFVYNTPYDIPEIEEEMRNFEMAHDNLRIIKVPGSKSKADNVNYFLNVVPDSGADIISIFDADHYPDNDNLNWVATSFLKGTVDIVQGRCCIYNYGDTWLTKLISAEFDTIYGVFHPGRAALHGYGLFGGSNGHWNASLLRTLQFQGHMLTEDIDSTLRAITSGARIIYDDKVISYETAPTSLMALLKQRMRWTQGWTQVAIRHAGPSLKRGAYGTYWRSRLGLFFLLIFRELYFYLVSQLSFMLFASIAITPPRSWDAVYSALVGFKASLWALVLNLVCITALAIITIRQKSTYTKTRSIILFGAISPFYFFAVSIIAIFCHFREVVTKYDNWNPTKRT